MTQGSLQYGQENTRAGGNIAAGAAGILAELCSAKNSAAYCGRNFRPDLFALRTHGRQLVSNRVRHCCCCRIAATRPVSASEQVRPRSAATDNSTACNLKLQANLRLAVEFGWRQIVNSLNITLTPGVNVICRVSSLGLGRRRMAATQLQQPPPSAAYCCNLLLPPVPPSCGENRRHAFNRPGRLN